MAKRNLIDKIFGTKTQTGTAKTSTGFQLVNSSTSTFNAYSGNVMDSDISRACVRAITSHAGKLMPKHVRNDSINPNPYLKELLEQPNPYMSMQKVIEKLVYSREVYNNAFAYLKRDMDGYVREIYPINYSNIKLESVGGELMVRFQFWNGKNMQVPYTDLIHLRKDFNENDFYGDNSSSSIYNVMNVVNSTDQAITQSANNSNVIKWLMKFKTILRPEDRLREVKEFVDNYLTVNSSVDGAVASDSKYDLEQVDSKSYEPPKETMESYAKRIYAYFGVNEKIVLNQYTEDEWNSFYSSKIEPIAIELSQTFTYAIFSRRERGFGNKIIFSANRLTYANNSTKVTMAKELIPLGLFTINEMRQVFELEPVEGGDIRLQTLNVVNSEKANEYQLGKEDEDDGQEAATEDATEREGV